MRVEDGLDEIVIGQLHKKLLYEIRFERMRQEQLKAEGRFPWTCSDTVADAKKLAVLAEEFGEASREVVEMLIHDDKRYTKTPQYGEHRKNLRKELVQIAAVCLAWLESYEA